MHIQLGFLFLFISLQSIGQKDETKRARAFPITNYIVDLSDSVKVVQVFSINIQFSTHNIHGCFSRPFQLSLAG
jgi:hypothetical protein